MLLTFHKVAMVIFLVFEHTRAHTRAHIRAHG